MSVKAFLGKNKTIRSSRSGSLQQSLTGRSKDNGSRSSSTKDPNKPPVIHDENELPNDDMKILEDLKVKDTNANSPEDVGLKR